MSTRSNTIVKNMKTDEKVYLYRHCDGYLEGAGFDVLDALNKFVTLGKENTIQNIAEFIKEKCDGTYEDTDSIHGDIDYLYVIEVDGETPLKLRAYGWSMRKGDTDEELTDELEKQYVAEGNVLPYAIKVPSKDRLDELMPLITKLNSLTPPYRKAVEALVDELIKATVA